MCFASKQEVYFIAVKARGLRGQKFNCTHECEGMGVFSGQSFVTSWTKSLMDMAFATYNAFVRVLRYIQTDTANTSAKIPDNDLFHFYLTHASQKSHQDPPLTKTQ